MAMVKMNNDEMAYKGATHGSFRLTDDTRGDVYVWEIGVGDPEHTELRELNAGKATVGHVLAHSATDALQVAEAIFDTNRGMALWVRLVGAYGVYAAPNVIVAYIEGSAEVDE